MNKLIYKEEKTQTASCSPVQVVILQIKAQISKNLKNIHVFFFPITCNSFTFWINSGFKTLRKQWSKASLRIRYLSFICSWNRIEISVGMSRVECFIIKQYKLGECLKYMVWMGVSLTMGTFKSLRFVHEFISHK